MEVAPVRDQSDEQTEEITMRNGASLGSAYAAGPVGAVQLRLRSSTRETQ